MQNADALGGENRVDVNHGVDGRVVLTWHPLRVITWAWLVYATDTVALYDVVVWPNTRKLDFILPRDDDDSPLRCEKLF